eukprot:PITA_33005
MAPTTKDATWVHCDVVDGKMLCKYCKHPMGGGGIYRLKQHFAGIRGQVTPCDAPNEVIGSIRKEYLEKFEKYQEAKARERAIQDEIARKKELDKAMARREREKQMDISFNAARSPYYQDMWDAAFAVGKGFRGPTMHDLRGRLLQEEIASIGEHLNEYKESWTKTGCSIMLDGWIDGKNRTIINFLVFYPQRTMFLRSVDASDKVRDANLLFELLDDIVTSVGVHNVVQVITDNASNYVLAGKMLEAKYKTIFWTPCAAHFIDLMLEDIGKVEWVKNIVEHAKSITTYIYNHSWVVNLIRKNTRGKELVRLTITRFATHLLTLQSLTSQQQNLQKMLSIDEWNSSRWARSADGKNTKKKVCDNTFWKKAAEVVKIGEPLVKVLWL